MFKLHAEYALASESGDYFQVLFEEKGKARGGKWPVFPAPDAI
jgi:hypothetical protein